MEASDLVIYHPNRDKAESKATKAAVALLLVASAALIAVITAGGWSKLQGAHGVAIAWVLVYLIMAFFVMRWNRGLLPLAAGLAVIFGIMAGIAAPGWFERDKGGFADPALEPGLLGLLTLVLLAVQVLLIMFSIRGFTQQWNVEVEVPRARAERGLDPRDFEPRDEDYVPEGRTDPDAQPGTVTDPQADRGPQDSGDRPHPEGSP